MTTEPQPPIIGQFDHLEAAIGKRGMGKTTLQEQLALALQRESGAYVIGHSLGARLARHLPKELGGDTIPLKYYPSISKLESGLRWHPARWHILAPPLEGDGNRYKGERESADDLLKFALRLSTRLKKQAWEKKHFPRLWNPYVDYDGVHCRPVIVIIDEGIAVESAGQSRKEDNRWFLEFLYSLRHNHIALFYSIQDGTARSWRLLEQATEIRVFRVTHQWALDALRAAGATEEELHRIRTQGRYSYVEVEALNVKVLEKASENKVPGQDEAPE